jgi:hypothetical protein
VYTRLWGPSFPPPHLKKITPKKKKKEQNQIDSIDQGTQFAGLIKGDI